MGTKRSSDSKFFKVIDNIMKNFFQGNLFINNLKIVRFKMVPAIHRFCVVVCIPLNSIRVVSCHDYQSDMSTVVAFEIKDRLSNIYI